MKKNIFYTSVIAMSMLMSCDVDDVVPTIDPGSGPTEEPANPPEEPTEEGSVVLNEFSYSGNWVEIYNPTSSTVDASDYFLCLGPGTYRSLGSLTALAGSVEIESEGFLVVEYDLFSGAQGGLGLYINNTNFTDPDTISDFVQFGSSESSRVNVAVEAGIWEDGYFVPSTESEGSSLAYDGEGNSSSDWFEASAPTVGSENIVAEVSNVLFYNEP